VVPLRSQSPITCLTTIPVTVNRKRGIAGAERRWERSVSRAWDMTWRTVLEHIPPRKKKEQTTWKFLTILDRILPCD
jgi:hypothetical protein